MIFEPINWTQLVDTRFDTKHISVREDENAYLY